MVNRLYFQQTNPYTGDIVEHTGLAFHNVAYSSCDVTSETSLTQYTTKYKLHFYLLRAGVKLTPRGVKEYYAGLSPYRTTFHRRFGQSVAVIMAPTTKKYMFYALQNYMKYFGYIIRP